MKVKHQYKPAILVVAYNREHALKRLLNSLNNSDIPDDVTCIISIDKAENNKHIFDLANNFQWKSGKKEVIYQETNLGLRNHIIKGCGLVDTYGSLIVLEDDLLVSRHFYRFAQEALNFYGEDERIAGVSLYKYPAIERRVNPLPFTPLDDNSDVHFIQFASSWGQAWTKNQWNQFLNWYNKKPNIKSYWGKVPFVVSDWPGTSWKKFFITYMIEHNKYFVYPNIALSTNFDDPGTNRRYETMIYQSNLQIKEKTYAFKKLDDSESVYDAWFEISPSILKKYNRKLSSYDFEVDLYGLRRPNESRKEYILTTQKSEVPIFEFGRKLKPHESNIIFDIQGKDIFLSKTADVPAIIDKNKKIKFHIFYEKEFSLLMSDLNYFFRKPLSLKENISFILKQIKRKFIK